MVLLKLLGALATGFACVAGVSAQNPVCNNAASLCSRAYNNITHLGAHDSPYVRNSSNSYSIAGNQFYTTLQQLDAGVRLVSAQVHAVTGNGQTQLRLCHSLCQLYDAGYLVDWLTGIKGWLDRHPNDVVTILLVNSDDASASTLGGIYQAAGLAQYSYQPSSTTQPLARWPTLNEMISQNKRAVSFVASLDPSTNQAAPYLLDEFTFVFENSYENIQPSDFSCEPDRPPSLSGNTRAALSSGRMPLMNHFRYDNISGFDIPAVNDVNVTNAPSGGAGNLGTAAANCSRIYGRAPTFILTDFTNIGPAIDTVDRLNGVQGQTSGRLLLPDTSAGSIADPSPTSTQPSSPATSSSSVRSSSGSASASASGSASSTTASSSVSSSGSARIASDSVIFTLWTAIVTLVFTISLGRHQ